MDIKFIFGFQHFGDRINNSFLNIIEMVPINQFSDEKLEDINYFSSEVLLKISDFTIKYEWKNISEIILNGFGLDSNNLFEVHPEMPSVGRQVNLSVEWHFKD